MLAAISLIFTAVFLVSLATYLVFQWMTQSPAAHLKRRLRRLRMDRNETSGRATTLLREPAKLETAIFDLPLLNKLRKLIHHSGIAAKPSAVLTILATLSFGGFCIVYIMSFKILTAVIGAVTLPFLFIGYLSYLKQQREKKFAEQLPEVLMMVSRSLRAGHSLPTAVELVSQEMPEPAQGLFRVAYEQQQLGMRMADALETLIHKIHCTDLHYFVTIIKINSESGGNLSDILDKLGETITSRLQIRKQVEVLTAEGRLSGYILMLLPVVVFFIFKVKNPEYMSVFFTEQVCQMILVIAAVGQVVGFISIRKIVNIRI